MNLFSKPKQRMEAYGNNWCHYSGMPSPLAYEQNQKRMSKEEPKVDATVSRMITDYVHDNYKNYRGKNLLIMEYDSCYTIRREHDPNSSPLILSKKVIQ